VLWPETLAEIIAFAGSPHRPTLLGRKKTKKKSVPHLGLGRSWWRGLGMRLAIDSLMRIAREFMYILDVERYIAGSRI
jgi:hypothetical protein